MVSERSWNHLWLDIDMQVVHNKLWLAELHNIVDSLKIALQPKRKWKILVHYILKGIILRAKCCILFQISMTYDSKVQMTKCLRWFCLRFVFPTGDMLFLESTRMTTQFKNTCHQASVISYCFQAGSWYDHQGKSVLLTTHIGYIISSICLYIYHRWVYPSSYTVFNPRPLRPKGFCRLYVYLSVCLFSSSLLTQ